MGLLIYIDQVRMSPPRQLAQYHPPNLMEAKSQMMSQKPKVKMLRIKWATWFVPFRLTVTALLQVLQKPEVSSNAAI
jgi:hypothetical protein